jgi:hypothetical protein
MLRGARMAAIFGYPSVCMADFGSSRALCLHWQDWSPFSLARLARYAETYLLVDGDGSGIVWVGIDRKHWDANGKQLCHSLFDER